jgi:hypothetical protein
MGSQTISGQNVGNIKVFICTKHAQENKQNKLTMKQFRIDVMEEQVKAMEELIASLTKNHTNLIEILIKSNNYAMKEMLALLKCKTKNSGNHTNATNKTKKKKHDETHTK